MIDNVEAVAGSSSSSGSGSGSVIPYLPMPESVLAGGAIVADCAETVAQQGSSTSRFL